MGRPNHGRAGRRAGTPSFVLDLLQQVGRDARLGYALAARPSKTQAQSVVAERARRARADAYDAALTASLVYVDRLREQLGSDVADVVERRYIDGMGWREAGEPHGMDANRARSMAARALDWLDATQTVPTDAARLLAPYGVRILGT